MSVTMQPATAARLAKLIPMLGSDKPGEVTATAAAIGRVLAAAGMDWHGLAGLAAGAATPKGAAFTFASLGPSPARKAMGLLQGRPGVTPQQRAILEAVRVRLIGASGHSRLRPADTDWLDALWFRHFGSRA